MLENEYVLFIERLNYTCDQIYIAENLYGKKLCFVYPHGKKYLDDN